jgi:hypothetical protein
VGAITEVQAAIDGAKIAIAKLSEVDDHPLSRKLTAKAFLAAAVALGATEAGIIIIDEAFNGPNCTEVLHSAWTRPNTLRSKIMEADTSGPLRVGRGLGTYGRAGLETHLAALGATMVDFQAWTIARVAKQHPETFGKATDPDAMQTTVGKLMSERDAHLSEMLGAWTRLDAAIDELGIRPQRQYRRTA